ncbi:SGNH/GDSL hydrolase family protein [Alcaligenaceae bacterium]|nr:SGNH/GDSL hydrolase family protein [Alcaligenaceae bacterium]
MAKEPISIPQLENASEDAQDWEHIVNDDEPALIQTRIGGPKPNYAMIVAGLAAAVWVKTEALLPNPPDFPEKPAMVYGDTALINGLWNWNASTAKWERAPESSQPLSYNVLNGLISGNVSTRYYELLSEDRFPLGWVDSDDLNLPNFRVQDSPDLDGLSLVAGDGYELLNIGSVESSFGPLYLRRVDVPALEVVSEDGFITADLLSLGEGSGAAHVDPVADITPYSSKLLCGVQGVPVSIYARNILSKRDDERLVRATLASDSLPVVITSSDEMQIMPDDLGSTATLTVRAVGDGTGIRTALPITVKVADNPYDGAALTPKILMIGDSIGNRQGGSIMKRYLTEWGYGSSFIGTIKGSDNASDPDADNGELGECREGWETGDFTNQITDRVSIIAPGGEGAYMSLPKLGKWPINPFLRASTGGDDPGIIRNGNVLDFGFYQSRFSLSTPEVILYSVGTNDVRDRSPSEIYDAVYDNDSLIYQRIRAAWPNAIIIRTLPGASRTPVRDDVWTDKYIPVIRAMMQAINDTADAKIVLAPAWAMVTQEAGYSTRNGVVNTVTGSKTTTLLDPNHPIGPARQQLHRALAGYVACAASGLI